MLLLDERSITKVFSTVAKSERVLMMECIDDIHIIAISHCQIAPDNLNYALLG